MAKSSVYKKTKKSPPKKRGRGHPKTDTTPGQYGDPSEFKLPPHKILAHYVPGRPTMYKPEYCQPLIEHMAEGFSFESFAGYVSTSSDTLNTWVHKHAEFAAAKKLGRELNRKWWEAVSRKNAMLNSGNAAGIRFNMINRFRGEWTDSQHVDLTTKGKEIQKNVNLTNVTEETLRRLIAESDSGALEGGTSET
jgi:hypothetical protein